MVNYILMPSGVLLEHTHYLRLQILSKGWIYPDSVGLPPSLRARQLAVNPIVESPQGPADARIHHPRIQDKEEDGLEDCFDKCFDFFQEILASAPSRPLLMRLPEVVHYLWPIVVHGREEADEVLK